MKSIFIVLPLCGAVLLSQGAYIHAKAILAQILLKSAWSQTTQGQTEVRPWPWADTWPVSRLSVPRLGISRIVLAGTSGSSLAFGPGLFSGSTLPGGGGNIVIAGHRDTHFKFMKEIKIYDFITLENNQGKQNIFKVNAIEIVDENDTSYLSADENNKLTLITCFPFDAIDPGGPLRYVITAGSYTPESNSIL